MIETIVLCSILGIIVFGIQVCQIGTKNTNNFPYCHGVLLFRVVKYK